ncbi:MAG: hypothetical protein JNL73_19455 [Anaerolineales bacterium]|nr:hypothetical protein [Anaerolineales bacterium]
MSTSPAPRAARLYLIGACLLGGLLIWGGLLQRITGAYFDLGLLTPVAAWLSAAGLSALDVGWPMIVLGSTLIGSGFGVYIGRRWAWQMAMVASGLALIYLWPGAVIGVIGLTLLSSSTLRAFCIQ